MVHFVCYRMTSTNVNVGLSDGRNSSRILKPPGGGHTDIFGAQHDEEPRAKPVHHNKTEISECFATNLDNGKAVAKEFDKQENNKAETDDKQATDENSKPAEEQKTAPPSRVRVPPGGFSSGFW